MTDIVKIENCQITKTGLKFSERLSFEQWQEVGKQLQKIHGSIQWWIGDWLRFGERKYGETYSQAIEETGLDYDTLTSYKWVSGAFEFCPRGQNLSWSAHREIASAPEDKRAGLLEKADKEGMTSREIKEIVKGMNALPTPKLPKGKYNVIYADPPWAYDVDLSSGATRSPENNYPVMDLESIKKFGDKVQEISAKDCILFLWITAPKFNWLFETLESWGFEYKTNFIWDKIKPNMGHYSSVRHEILIIAGKGKCAPTCDGKTIQSIDSVQSIDKSSTHSQKPKEFIEIIEKLYPNHKYIELFARKNNKREGWTFWGNESND